jgi:tetratricopeptide (TPR) repeat protein
VAALAWSIESGELDVGLRLGCALEAFWAMRGHLKEGMDQFLFLLAQPGAAVPGVTRVRALASAARFADLQRDYELTKRLGEESLAMARAVEDREGIATALFHLAQKAGWDPRSVRPLVEEGVAIRRELGDPRGIAGALAVMAWIHRLEGDQAAERARAEESLAIWRALGDRARISSALISLGLAISRHGDRDTAEPLIEEALAIARELNDKIGIAQGILTLGNIAHWREDYPAARALFEQCLPLWRELDHKDGQLESVFHLGYVNRPLGEFPAAYAWFEEMLAIAHGMRANEIIAAALFLLGGAAADLGRWEEAATRCSESLTRIAPHERTDQHHIGMALARMARIALARERPARAALLLGAVPGLIAATNGLNKWPVERNAFERLVSAVRDQLGEAEFATAWAEGQAMPVELVIAEALEEKPKRSPTVSPRPPLAPG